MTPEDGRGPRPTDSLIGYDLDAITPPDVIVTLPRLIEAGDLPVRDHEGWPSPNLPMKQVYDSLALLGVSATWATIAGTGPHVSLDMRTPWVRGRGYVNLIRTWHVWSDVPRADWLSWLDGNRDGGIIELWLDGLQPGSEYILDIAVTGTANGTGAVFRVGSSAGFWADYPVSGYKTQHLLGVLQPRQDRALVHIDHIALDSVSFHSAVVRKV
jgi:hypothetical protein